MKQAGEMKKRRTRRWAMRLTLLLTLILTGRRLPQLLPQTLAKPARAATQTNQPSAVMERNRERAHLRQEFARHFRTIQVRSQEMIREFEAGRLTEKRLASHAKEINKSARILRQLIALGELAQPEELKTSFSSPGEMAEAIRLLAGRVREFARNPTHQNSRILNTDLATEAQTDLLAVIRLSKALNEQARLAAPR